MSVDVNKQIVYYKDFNSLKDIEDYDNRLASVGLTMDVVGSAPEWDSENQILKNISGCEFYYTGNDPLLKIIKVKSADGKQYEFFDVAEKKWLDNPDSIPLAAASYAMDALDCYLMDNQQTWKDHTCRYDYNETYFPQSIGISSLESIGVGSFTVGDCDLYGWKDSKKSEKWTEYIRPRSIFKPEESDYDHWQIHSDDPILIAQNFTSSTNKIDGTYSLNNGVLNVNGQSYYVGPNAHLCLFVRQGNGVSSTIDGEQTEDFLCRFIDGYIYGVELFGDVGTIAGLGGVNESKQDNTTILTYNKNKDQGALNYWIDGTFKIHQPQITGNTKVTCYTSSQININNGKTNTSSMTKTSNWDYYIQSDQTTAVMSWDMFATHEAWDDDGNGLKDGITSVEYNITKQNNKYTMTAEVQTNTNKVNYNIPTYVGITSANGLRYNTFAIYSGMAYEKNTIINNNYSDWTVTKALILNNLAKFTFELQTLSFINAQPQQIKWVSNGYTIRQYSSGTTATVTAIQSGYIEGLPGVISSGTFTLISREYNNNNWTGSINYTVDSSYNKPAYCVAVLFDK